MPRYRIQVKDGKRWVPFEDAWYGSKENADRMLTLLGKQVFGVELRVAPVRKRPKKRRQIG